MLPTLAINRLCASHQSPKCSTVLAVLIALVVPSPLVAQDSHRIRRATTDDLTYVWVPSGTFDMGCVAADEDCFETEKPPHHVAITEGFWIGQTEVTVGAYRRFTEETVAAMPPAPFFNPSWGKLDHPVVNVPFQGAANYCAWVGGRLPSEAEWEYAARGGRDGLKYPWGNAITHDDANYGKDQRWAGLAKGRDQWVETSPVASFAPNGFGLHDVIGNVSEWVADWFVFYEGHPAAGTIGVLERPRRVVRGGAWFGDPQLVRTSVRIKVGPNYRGDGVGFRCVIQKWSNP